MSLIVDASVAVKWVADEPGSADARELLRSGERLIAPEIVLSEVGNALRKKVAQGIMEADQALQGLAAIERAFDRLSPVRTLVPAALDLALRAMHPVYDCLYLAYARREGLPLVTADERLVATAARMQIAARAL